MTSIFPRKERLKKHELILPIIAILLLMGLLNGIRKFHEVTPDVAGPLGYLAFITGFSMFSFSQFIVRIRFTRPYNTLLWLIPSVILFALYYWLSLHPQLVKSLRPNELSGLRLPLISLLFRHVMRLIHIVIYKTEPLFVGKGGPIFIDEENRWDEIPSDKGFSVFEMIGHFIILLILLPKY